MHHCISSENLDLPLMREAGCQGGRLEMPSTRFLDPSYRVRREVLAKEARDSPSEVTSEAIVRSWEVGSQVEKMQAQRTAKAREGQVSGLEKGMSWAFLKSWTGQCAQNGWRARGEGVGGISSLRTLQAKVGSWRFVMVSDEKAPEHFKQGSDMMWLGFSKEHLQKLFVVTVQEAQGGLVQESIAKARKDVMAARAKL